MSEAIRVYHFLVNRSAGNGRGQFAWSQIQPFLDKNNVQYRVSYPGNAADAANHVRSLGSSVQTLVVVGGDGTIQSVLSEVVAKHLNFGLIPAGSGNDVARNLHISLNPLEAIVQLLQGAPKPVDLIRHGSAYYATAIGVGFDGAIAFAANQSGYKKWLNKLRLGRLTYVVALLQVLFRYHPTDVELVLDETITPLQNVWLIAIANFPSYGGGMSICPQAKWDDGFLEVCVVQNVSKLELLRVFPKVYTGRHTTHPAVQMFQAKHVKVTSREPLMAHGDGEVVGNTPLDASLFSTQFNIVSPQPVHGGLHQQEMSAIRVNPNHSEQ